MKDYTNNEILHVKSENKTEHIEFKRLNDYNVKNAIFLRHGGVSHGVYSSLNLRIASNDNLKNIEENMSRVTEVIGVDKANICKASQAHTDNVIYLNHENYKEFNYALKNELKADAYIVNETGICTMITTADCVPIILYDTKKNIVANIHSGWKGTIQQIYLKALEKMKIEFETNPYDVLACLGPSIRKCCFTTQDPAFKKQFLDIWGAEDEYIYTEENGTIHIDLKYVITKDLIKAGVRQENIIDANICTKCNHDDFYSYRITTQNKEEDYATFATFVSL